MRRIRIDRSISVASIAWAAVLAFAITATTGCGDGGGATASATRIPASASPPYTVTCTVGMLADIVSEIGGDRLAVTSLMGPGTDPHLYPATPSDREQLLRSHAIFYCGHHLEGRMSDVLEKMGSKVPTLAVCEEIPDSQLLTEDNAFDPHLWFDVALWSQCARTVFDQLVAIDPAGKELYTKNIAALETKMAALHTESQSALASVPKERRVLITAHDAFGYLGRAYDVEVIGVQGLSTESEAGVGRVEELVQQIVDRGVPAVFVESTISEKNVRALVEGCRARGHELKIGGELYSDAMGAADTPAGNYFGMVKHNVRTIVEALK